MAGNIFVRDAQHRHAGIFRARAVLVLVLSKVLDFQPRVPSSKFLPAVRKRAGVAPIGLGDVRRRNLGYFGVVSRLTGPEGRLGARIGAI